MEINRFEILENACPICEGDLRGNGRFGYLCTRCFVKFTKDNLMSGIFSKEYPTRKFF